MTGKEEKAHVLPDCLGKGQNMAELIQYAKDSIVSKTILDKSAGTITLFAFDKGQKLSEHTAPYDAVVQVLDGRCQVKNSGRSQRAFTGTDYHYAGQCASRSQWR